jgi:hypothetical protein
MTEDERMLTEGRTAGNQYIASFNGDWDAMLADLEKKRQEGQSAGFKSAGFKSADVQPSISNASTSGRLPIPQP